MTSGAIAYLLSATEPTSKAGRRNIANPLVVVAKPQRRQ